MGNYECDFCDIDTADDYVHVEVVDKIQHLLLMFHVWIV